MQRPVIEWPSGSVCGPNRSSLGVYRHFGRQAPDSLMKFTPTFKIFHPVGLEKLNLCIENEGIGELRHPR